MNITFFIYKKGNSMIIFDFSNYKYFFHNKIKYDFLTKSLILYIEREIIMNLYV